MSKLVKTWRRGPSTPFGPKELPNVSHSMTAMGKRILKAASSRCLTSQSNVVEACVRRSAGALMPSDFVMAERST